MLRTALLMVAALMSVAGAACVLTGHAQAWPPTIWGVVLLLAVLFERWRYRKQPSAQQGSWQITGERFIDPESGEPMEVHYNPASGERRYVRSADQPAD
ncbi:hypothetical protein [Rugamonas sp.]|uniref:hypothetical protein n=1 Tax=Rugamonas sp. TaxID=1926287 RepID=UPI0025D7680D|nr:hypothetical protein [Rugamonas sp.]